eukprot:scaffold35068_cov120-Isochrysis_galbana.AAC.3
MRAPKRKRSSGEREAGGPVSRGRPAVVPAPSTAPRSHGQQTLFDSMRGSACSRPAQRPPASPPAAARPAYDGGGNRLGGGSGARVDDCIEIISDSGSPEPPTWA